LGPSDLGLLGFFYHVYPIATSLVLGLVAVALCSGQLRVLQFALPMSMQYIAILVPANVFTGMQNIEV